MRRGLIPSSLLPVLWVVLWLGVGWALYASEPAQNPKGRAAAIEDSEKPATSNDNWPFVLEAQGVIPQPTDAPTAHASNLLALPHDPQFALAAFWFAGSQEGAEDVQIAMSRWSRQTQTWTSPEWVVNRHRVAAALGKGVRRLGNPVAWLDTSDRIHLFVVGTGLGGWAAARVLHLRQAHAPLQAHTLDWDVVGNLPLSWFWNISHLVRHAPMPLADGGMVLPVYFELGAKYPVFAWFSPDGDFQGVKRFTGRRNVLQAAPVAIDAQHWLAYLRTQGPDEQVAVIETQDAGLHWALQADLDLSNTDAAIAALRLPDGHLVMARNPKEGYRSQLLGHVSSDGVQWSTPHTLHRESTGEFAYPALAWQDNRLWLSYTNNRKSIAWQCWRPKMDAENRP